jgi:hypothetical protein
MAAAKRGSVFAHPRPHRREHSRPKTEAENNLQATRNQRPPPGAPLLNRLGHGRTPPAEWCFHIHSQARRGARGVPEPVGHRLTFPVPTTTKMTLCNLGSPFLFFSIPSYLGPETKSTTRAPPSLVPDLGAVTFLLGRIRFLGVFQPGPFQPQVAAARQCRWTRRSGPHRMHCREPIAETAAEEAVEGHCLPSPPSSLPPIPAQRVLSHLASHLLGVHSSKLSGCRPLSAAMHEARKEKKNVHRGNDRSALLGRAAAQQEPTAPSDCVPDCRVWH